MHRPYTRIPKCADTAVLFIHGIVSTPQHFERLIARLPPQVSVMNLLLAGHGGTAWDLTHGSMALWQLQVDSALTYLAMDHRRVLVVGHSMGTLLALDAALRHPDCVTALFLLDVPLSIHVRPLAVINSLHLGLSLPLRENDEYRAAKASFGVTPTRNPLPYLGWTMRYHEMFCLAHRLRREVSALRVPCFAFQSGKDEMVGRSAADLLRRNPLCTVDVMEQSYHFWYAPEEDARMLHAFDALVAAS